MDARRVLIAWIVVMQLLAYPFVALGALMGLAAVPIRLEYWLPISVILGLSLLGGTPAGDSAWMRAGDGVGKGRHTGGADAARSGGRCVPGVGVRPRDRRWMPA